MTSMHDLYKSGEWKTEKHVPAIDVEDNVSKGQPIGVRLTVGKEIAHPNTSEHHIVWTAAYFQPDGSKFPYEIGRFVFSAHGASVDGPNTSTVFTAPDVSFTFKTDKSGTIFASSYCNIHGLWENSKTITVR
jgi:superoxide reductase